MTKGTMKTRVAGALVLFAVAGASYVAGAGRIGEP